MSVHQAFRRVPVPAQVQAKSTPYIIPAPTRGIVQSENYTFMQPGAAIIQDNWVSTMRGVKLRGGFVRWCDLHAGVPVPDPSRLPIISGFEYLSANVQKMYAANATTLFDVSAATPIIVKSGQHSGNYSASQLSDGAGDYLMVVNDAGDPPLRFNGTAWTTLNSGQITGPPGSAVVAGANLCYVWKYRNRYFFIEVIQAGLPVDPAPFVRFQAEFLGKLVMIGQTVCGLRRERNRAWSGRLRGFFSCLKATDVRG